MNCGNFGCLDVVKINIFIVCFVFKLHEVLLLLYTSYLYYMFDIYLLHIYMYIVHFFLLFISIFILFDFKFA